MMRISHQFSWFTVVLLLLMVSCIPQKETLYLQDKEPEMEFKEMTTITGKYYLQPNDYLFINVSTFNKEISEFLNATGGNSNINTTQQGGSNFYYYLIDDSMNIDFPYAGKINLRDCNIPMAKEKIKEALKPIVKDPNLIVRLATNYFTILGEVGNPGPQRMTRDQITIFEAIGMAGDITTYGKRRDIKIVRPKADGTTETINVDLTDKNIIGSEFYYIYPNDFIYIRPMKAKQWGIGETFSLGLLSTLLSFTITIIALTK